MLSSRNRWPPDLTGNRKQRRAEQARGKRFPLTLEVLPLRDPASQERIAEIVARYQRMLADPTITPAERQELEAGQARAISTQNLLAMLDPVRPKPEAMH